MNCEFPDVQTGFRKGREIRDQIAYICWIIEKTRELKKQTNKQPFTSALLTTPKPLTVWIKTDWKILQEMGIPDHLTCLLRNLCEGQEATIRIGYGAMD